MLDSAESLLCVQQLECKVIESQTDPTLLSKSALCSKVRFSCRAMAEAQTSTFHSPQACLALVAMKETPGGHAACGQRLEIGRTECHKI